MIKDLKKQDTNSKKILTNESLIEKYCHFMYRIYGRKLLLNEKFSKIFYRNFYNKKYEKILSQANLRLIPEEYFISIFMSLSFFLLASIVFSVLLSFTHPIWAMLLFYIGVFGVAVIGIFMYNYPVVTAKSRGSEVDASIPYVLPYMKILSKELSLAKIIDIIDDFLIYKQIKIEFQRIKYYYSVMGYDLNSSIRSAMESCPSKNLSDMMNDLVTISNSGGNIYTYLERKLENLNKEINAIESKSIDTLLIYSQIYVVILLISPLFYTIMSSILNMIDISAAAGDSIAGSGSGTGVVSSIVMLLFFLPIAYIAFMTLIYYSKPLYSRLEPINEK